MTYQTFLDVIAVNIAGISSFVSSGLPMRTPFAFAFAIPDFMSKINRTHHRVKPENDVSNFFMKVFAELFSKSDRKSFYVQASSIATATATVIP